MRRSVVAAGLALLLSACVSTEKFEQSEAALAACRDSAAAQAAQGEQAQRRQQERIDALTREHASCREEMAVARSSLQGMDARAAQLRRQLQDEIAAKDVEIEQLRDRLSVRVLDRILFRSGSAEILPPGRAVLDKLADVLADSEDHIRVEGHTDVVPIGTHLRDRYPTNWELSTARASSVVRYFEAARKIDPRRLEAVGFSLYRPVAPGDTPEALQRNRRVEIVLTAEPASE